MTARGRKKVAPQIVAIELIIIAAAALAIYFLVPLSGAPQNLAEFLAGMGADRLLILVLRHGKKKGPRKRIGGITITRQPVQRKPAGRRPT